MGDSYAEAIVRDEKDVKGIQFKAGMIFLTLVILLIGARFDMFILTLGILMIPVDFILFKNRCREYEYLLVSEELEVTLIKNRKKRKKQGVYPLVELQCMAPISSKRLDGYRHNPNLKVRNYSSGNPEHRIYSMILPWQGAIMELQVEPTEAMMQEIRRRHASVVYED